MAQSDHDEAQSFPASYEFDISAIRRKFPALHQETTCVSPVYFDNPGGTQVPDSVINAMRRYLIEANSNTHGPFHTSQLTDLTISEARKAMADLLNAPTEKEIIFGPNMTTLTFSISRAIGRTFNAGDEIVVTHMDHDANITPWTMLARDHELVVKWVGFDPLSGRLNYEQLVQQISNKTRLVACVYASNALGTINDICRVIELAHGAGALVYIDAVQYAPHGPIDVAALNVDFLACSAYKFFGPHVGVLYGKLEHLERLPAYKVRPASNQPPEKWETGTQNHEGLAGITAAVEYLAGIGERFGRPFRSRLESYSGRRLSLKQAMHAIQHYEQSLSRKLLEGLGDIHGVKVLGITAPEHLNERVPTIIFNVAGKSPRDVAAALGEACIYVWDGNYYALEVMERLGLEGQGGAVRVGPVHYNTLHEIDRFLEKLENIAIS